jgi:cell division protein FtsL
MSPRNTQHEASASARKAPSFRRSAAPSARARTTPSVRDARPAAGRRARDASWFRWWLLPLLIVGAIALFAVTYYPVARVQYRETRQRAQLQAEYSALQQRNARLGTMVARLKTTEGIQDYAQSQLGMVKQGENVVVVTDGSHPSQPATPAIAGPPQLENSGETTVAPSGPWTAFLDAVFRVQ